MTQAERRLFLIQALKDEQAEYRDLRVPRDAMGQRKLLRSLLNVRAPGAVGDDFLAVQDDYLQQELAEDGVTRAEDLSPVSGDLCLWQGDITRLQCGAIVNAANSGLTGCYLPCHACIDNCIHTYAGIQLRQDCAALMAAQGHAEPAGQAKITRAYNLPCDYVLHTVGPIVEGPLTPFSSGPGRGSPPPPVSPTAGSASSAISGILPRSTASGTCIPAGFTPSLLRRNSGPTGAAISF